MTQPSSDSTQRAQNYCVNCAHRWYTRAKAGRPKCPKCGHLETHVGNPEEIISTLEGRWHSESAPLGYYDMYSYVSNSKAFDTDAPEWIFFSAALCRRLWSHMTDERWKQAVEFMEDFARNPTIPFPAETWTVAHQKFGTSFSDVPSLPTGAENWTAELMAPHVALLLISDTPQVAAEFIMVRLICVMQNEGRREEHETFQRETMRRIFGNPFRLW